MVPTAMKGRKINKSFESGVLKIAGFPDGHILPALIEKYGSGSGSGSTTDSELDDDDDDEVVEG